MNVKTRIIYSSVDGQTLKICEKIRDEFLQNNQSVELFSIDDFNKEVTSYDRLVIGASIRYGVHNKKVIDFINANKIDRQRVNLKLGRSFLNDKVIVNVGGDLDFNVRSSTNIQNDNLQWLPDLNIEFILTRDRKLRLIVFNRNSLDINGSSLGRRNRQGVSISYRKDFEKFLF